MGELAVGEASGIEAVATWRYWGGASLIGSAGVSAGVGTAV